MPTTANYKRYSETHLSDGVIQISQGVVYVGGANTTLTLPPASIATDNGSELNIVSITNSSHTITGDFVDGIMSITTPPNIGDAVTMYAYNGQWIVSNQSNQIGGTSGWIDYNDASTSTTPLNLVANTWTTLPNDGEGLFTNKSYRPRGITELLDVSTGALDFTQLNLGDVTFIRTDFIVTPSVNNALLQFRLQLGSGAGTYTLSNTLGRLDNGSGIPYQFALDTKMVYMGDANTRDNPCLLQVNCSVNSTLVNNGLVIEVTRNV